MLINTPLPPPVPVETYMDSSGSASGTIGIFMMEESLSPGQNFILGNPKHKQLDIVVSSSVSGNAGQDLHGFSGVLVTGKVRKYFEGDTINGSTQLGDGTKEHPWLSVKHWGEYLAYVTGSGNLGSWNTATGTNNRGSGAYLGVEEGGLVGDVHLDGDVRTYHSTIQNAGEISSFINNANLTSTNGYSIINYKTGIIDSFINTGTITGSILNAGTIKGNISLGNAHIVIAGENTAQFGGDVSGDNQSVFSIGDENYQGIFATTGRVSVGRLTIGYGSQLSVTSDNDWHVLTSDENSISNAGTIVMNNGATLSGNLKSTGIITLSDEKFAAATIDGNLDNSGRIILNPNVGGAGNRLIINGNYTGELGSSVQMGGVLAGDDSQIDKLHIFGDTAGISALNISNEFGSGAQTLEGIEVVQVDGNSAGTFTQGNRVVAGAFDYTLQKGNSSGTDDKNWYLTSFMTPQPQPQPARIRMVRPETGAYAANLEASRTMFNLSLHDRAGTSLYNDPNTGETQSTSMWIRNEGGRTTARLDDGQNKFTGNRYVMQMGGNVATLKSDSAGQLSFGLMGGYANQSSNTHNALTKNDAKGSVNGYSAGIYGTWYQNPKDKSGLYVDSWLQYNWFHNKVKGRDLVAETYKSQGLGASAETGYSWQLESLKDADNSFWLQPHAQLIWTGVKANDYTESNGTRVQGTGSDGVETKLGLRTFMKRKSTLNPGTVREFKPFVEINWLYHTKNNGVRMNGDEDHINGLRNVGELKTGIEGEMAKNLNVGVSVGQQMAGKGYRDTNGMLGVKYDF